MTGTWVPRLAAAAAAAAMLCAGAARAALVDNGGFESGDFSGWTLGGDSSFSGVAAGIEHGGSFAAFFGPDPSGSISQLIDTAQASAYVISFWLALDDSAQPNAFTVRWGGTEVEALSDATQFDYTRYSVLVPSGGATTMLQFEFANPQSFWRIDDIEVTVPEPATPLLALSALALVAGVRRRVAP